MPKVSVIVPIYNVEIYFERCLHSLFNQTLDDIEYIFVDDASPDRSVDLLWEIVDNYQLKKAQVKLIRHETNKGLSVARKTGIDISTGDYIIHCDSDDYVELDIYEKLYKRAIKTNSDIVTCYHFLDEKPVFYDFFSSPQKCLKNIYKKNSHYVHSFNKLVKSELIKNNSIWPDPYINFEEDLITTVKLFHYANSISVVKEPLYHYCLRNNSLSTSLYKKFDPVKLESLESLLTFLRIQGKGHYRKLENYLIYKIKFNYPEIFKDERLWFDWHKECHIDILSFDEETLKSRIVLWLAMINYDMFKLFKKWIPTLNYVDS